MFVIIRELAVSEYIPKILPPHWQIIDAWGDGWRYRTRDGLAVIVSTAQYEDGREWMHISVSRKDRLPSWDDLKHVKEVIVGNDRYAYQVFPPASQYVNIHQFCLHMWAPLTGSLPVPEFGSEGTI